VIRRRFDSAFARSLAVCVLALTLAPAGPALAESVTVNWTGTVSSATGDLNGPIAASDTVTCTLVYESNSAGVFTPSPNPMFVRAEMLYASAITSVELTVNGETVSGNGGAIHVFDSLNGVTGGADNWESTATISTGTIGGVAPSSILFDPWFSFEAWTLSDGDPVPAPLDQAQSTFLQFSLGTPGGGTAYGSISSYTVSGGGPAPVPMLGAWGIALLVAAIVLGARWLASNRPAV